MNSPSKWLVHIVLVVGGLQMAGYLTGLKPLRDLGFVSTASPLPLVFREFRGFETFAASFEVELTRHDGTVTRTIITPERYSRLNGPYNRRNTYGAVMAYGPRLTGESERALVDSVLGYGFCHGGPLASRFGESEPLRKVVAIVRSKTAGSSESWRRELPCGSR